MQNLAEVSKTSLAQRLQRAQDHMKRLRVEGQRITRATVTSTMVIAGGAAAGVIDKKMPTIGTTGIATSEALGAALVLAGVLELGGDYSDELSAIGSGMLAASAAKRVGAAV